MQIRGVDYVQVSARDLPRAVAFSRDTLGLPQTAGFPPDWYELDAGGTTIALSEPPADAPPAPAPHLGHLPTGLPQALEQQPVAGGLGGGDHRPDLLPRRAGG
jgi:catechol 2,3-dioxygenase-like lactoylglutathione lyase family enzyme